MKTTRLSSKGQVVIPKNFRAAHRWSSGLELLVIDTGDGLLLKPKAPFAQSSLEYVAGCLRREQRTLDAAKISALIGKKVREEWRDRD